MIPKLELTTEERRWIYKHADCNGWLFEWDDAICVKLIRCGQGVHRRVPTALYGRHARCPRTSHAKSRRERHGRSNQHYLDHGRAIRRHSRGGRRDRHRWRRWGRNRRTGYECRCPLGHLLNMLPHCGSCPLGGSFRRLPNDTNRQKNRVHCLSPITMTNLFYAGLWGL